MGGRREAVSIITTTLLYFLTERRGRKEQNRGRRRRLRKPHESPGGSNRRRRKRDRGSKQTQRRSGRKLHLAPFSFHALFGAKGGGNALRPRTSSSCVCFSGGVEPKNWVLLQSGVGRFSVEEEEAKALGLWLRRRISGKERSDLPRFLTPNEGERVSALLVPLFAPLLVACTEANSW